jgi:hypothetical protein
MIFIKRNDKAKKRYFGFIEMGFIDEMALHDDSTSAPSGGSVSL